MSKQMPLQIGQDYIIKCPNKEKKKLPHKSIKNRKKKRDNKSKREHWKPALTNCFSMVGKGKGVKYL